MGKRVLSAEVGKDVVSFLLSFISLPIRTVSRLLSSKDMVGSLYNLYESFCNLSSTYMQPNVDEDIVLRPKSSRCVIYNPKDICSHCRHTMSTYIPFVKSEASSKVGSTTDRIGYVIEMATYMVMDNLEVKPIPPFQIFLCLTSLILKTLVSSRRRMIQWAWLR
ncbi:hypothetical protein PanWU01x14_042870 [Parasponia andersonii]|uniref:Uncharacterized protein n=1 Tax=Parasponia andersonii TaxID=3476 RepID=A0A2P5DPW1_PARAD|nr:hypothetical protein PanWU01x14_042870 [Parasponia andersonii]